MMCFHLMCLACLDSILYYETVIMNKKGSSQSDCLQRNGICMQHSAHTPQKLADAVIARISIIMFIIII